ncbi:sugar-binding transcriptional regulator [Hoeflea prorocentri]|uniref:Sugar-binding transcriptional regulator n=1 Tax=Hoeflea prorocentri TaxID=1922333 RepID=A0A9X3ULT3_9HYPH|nr:sugar-binding transcriptional regulator [Hoeflea prorocentri]MCY6383598.1 sugar-binding transcriptional regulator [Hoeflea prorocentri]MDA5401398.1 sugar-binding transcriptional regulator [Hoeflea prorocentri]
MTRNGSRKRSRIEDQILEVAWYYFHQDLNQAEIAEKLNISRSTVVNYLAEARARDYVRVSLRPNVFTEREIAEALKSRFGLRDALVVPAVADDAAQSLTRVARATADWLPSLLSPGDRLGVSWGETVFKISVAAERIDMPDLQIVQLVGSRATPLGFAAEACSSNLAERFGALCINLHAPLIVQNPELASLLKQEPVIAEQFTAIKNCNKTLFAAGSCDAESHVVQNGLVSDETLSNYLKKGAKAVVCGRFIDGNGRPIPGEIDDRIIGATLDTMLGKELGLLASAGPDKVEPMRAAIKGGFATHVATCSQTAEALLEAA